VKASLGVHAAAFGCAAIWPGAAPGAVAALLLNHAALTAAGLWPRSTLLGPNITHLPPSRSGAKRWALTIDDGPDREVTPAVLDLLAEHGTRATFFCIAERARAEPALVRRMVREGHSVQNHTLRHRHHFSVSGSAALRREIAGAQTVLAEISGVSPHCFRAPAGLRNPLLDPVLHQLDLNLVSWTRRGFDTRETSPERVLARLTHGLGDGDILLLHDGNAARSSAGQAVLLAVLPRLLQAAQAAGLSAVTLSEALALRRTPGA
jgi:peptidoglycan/xylan/chitin deacetylase (PgdA/CDA1 family)